MEDSGSLAGSPRIRAAIRLVLAVIGFLAVVPVALAGENPAHPTPADRLRWRLDEQKRLPDGRVAVCLSLDRPAGFADGTPVSTRVLLTRWEYRQGGKLAPAERIAYDAVLPDAEGAYRLTVYGAFLGKLDIRSTAQHNGRTLRAQLNMAVFGTAEADERSRDEGSGFVEDHDGWIDTDAVVLAQTGREMRFAFQGKMPAQLHAAVYRAGAEFRAAVPVRNGVFVYTPPHDPVLSAAGGYTTHLNYVFTVDLPDRNEYFALTLPVYRSHMGHISYGIGLSVLGLSAALCGVAVLRRRKPGGYP